MCYRKDRSSGRGGAVLIYIRETLECNEIHLHTSLELLAMRIVLSPQSKFNIVVLYNPPSLNVSFYNSL